MAVLCGYCICTYFLFIIAGDETFEDKHIGSYVMSQTKKTKYYIVF